MNAVEQMTLLLAEIEKAKAEGKTLTIDQAQRKVHREYITKQLWNKHGLKPAGFLVSAGLCRVDGEGNKVADQKLYDMFNRYLIMASRLTKADGIRIRAALDALGVDYLNSPTYPLEPLENSAE